MINGFLSDKISKVSSQEINNNPTYQIASLGKVADFVKLDLNNSWYCSITGVTPGEVSRLYHDGTKEGFCIVRPNGRDIKVSYSPKFVDEVNGGPSGKLFGSGADSTKFAELLNTEQSTPTVFAISTAPLRDQQLGAVSTKQTQESVSVAGLKGQIGNEVKPFDPINTPGTELTPTINLFNFGGFLNQLAKGISGQTDVQPDGSVQKTRDNGLSASGTQIRTGTSLTDNTTLRNAAKAHDYVTGIKY